MDHIRAQEAAEENQRFFNDASTIGGFTIFPSNRVMGVQSINQARGCHPRIGDRFDLTLECFRLHYQGGESPLTKTLQGYSSFFDLFETFKGYVDFFHFQDLVTQDYTAVRPFLPFDDFQRTPRPENLNEYREYRRRVMDFITGRNNRIDALNAK